MFIPLLGFTDTDCTGRTDVVFFLHENPQFVSVKGTTKKADAFGLFVYPKFPIDAQPRGGNRQTAKRFCIHWTILLPCC